MHSEAELGLAAHWAYKQDKVRAATPVSWIRDLVEILDHAGSAEELLEHTRMAMYQDRIFAFTPDGELIQLPKGATAIDFAYAVHTIRRSGGRRKVNGRVVPLRTAIENGDQVRSCAPRRRSRSRAGSTSSSPARRAPRSAARAPQGARETIALGRKFYDEIVKRCPPSSGGGARRCAEAAQAARQER
jgi:(p)ppGpp synthase/HD superfamily hydrolase